MKTNHIYKYTKCFINLAGYKYKMLIPMNVLAFINYIDIWQYMSNIEINSPIDTHIFLDTIR